MYWYLGRIFLARAGDEEGFSCGGVESLDEGENGRGRRRAVKAFVTVTGLCRLALS